VIPIEKSARVRKTSQIASSPRSRLRGPIVDAGLLSAEHPGADFGFTQEKSKNFGNTLGPADPERLTEPSPLALRVL
jgi:hypothetical protein